MKGPANALMSRLSNWLFGLDYDRWIIVDVESSGLNARKDRLISIAATAIVFDGRGHPRIALSDSFEVILKQPPHVFAALDKSNILIHGIGQGAQEKGVEARVALQAFLDYVGDSPLIAFHSWFDETLINRALKKVLGKRTHRRWVDLEHVAAVLHREDHRLALDVWLQRYSIVCDQRHQAASDVMATAELFMRLWPMIERRKAGTWPGIQKIASGLKTLPGRGAF